MHYVKENLSFSNFSGFYTLDGKYHILFIVKDREPLISVQGKLVRLCHFPDSDWNPAIFFRLHRQVIAGSASFEKKLTSFNHRCSKNSCLRTAHFHLSDIEVASICSIVTFFHNIQSFQSSYHCLKTAEAVGRSFIVFRRLCRF